MKIQLSDHFSYGKLLKFTVPSIIMMVFTSIYGVVDGLFVSNFVGKAAFSAINLILPYIMMFGTLGIMVGTGGAALVSMTLGTGDRQRANQMFSQLVYFHCSVAWPCPLWASRCCARCPFGWARRER